VFHYNTFSSHHQRPPQSLAASNTKGLASVWMKK
jgi:hypothetical protein